MAQKYDVTLNLPKTDFPMRAGLPKREPEMLKHWEELDVYNEMLKKTKVILCSIFMTDLRSQTATSTWVTH